MVQLVWGFEVNNLTPIFIKFILWQPIYGTKTNLMDFGKLSDHLLFLKDQCCFDFREFYHMPSSWEE